MRQHVSSMVAKRSEDDPEGADEANIVIISDVKWLNGTFRQYIVGIISDFVSICSYILQNKPIHYVEPYMITYLFYVITFMIANAFDYAIWYMLYYMTSLCLRSVASLTWISLSLSLSLFLYIYIYIYIYTYIYIYMYRERYMYIIDNVISYYSTCCYHLYIYIHTYVCISLYIYIYIYIMKYTILTRNIL